VRTAEASRSTFTIRITSFAGFDQGDFSGAIQVLSGRGCSYRCTFALIPLRPEMEPRPFEEFIREVKSIVAKYNPRLIYFRDDNFFQSKERIEQFIAAYKECGFRFSWTALVPGQLLSSGLLHQGFLPRLQEVNCRTLKFGIESGSQEVLNSLKKGLRVDSVRAMMRDFKGLKTLRPNYSFMIGIPGETFEAV